MSSALARSRKARAVQETLCELVYRPLAHVVVTALAPLRVPPPVVAASAGTTGLVAALLLGRGHFVAAGLVVQVKTVLDNADGQLARLTGRVTAFGRYLDSELDLFVNAALFAGLGWATGRVLLPLLGFGALTLVLSVNFNLERLYRAEHLASSGGAAPAMPEALSRPAAALRTVYALLYAPQDRLVEGFVERRLLGASPQARLAYHDRPTVLVLANLGMSTQLAAFGACLVAGRPLAYAWICLAELAVVAVLALRRELLVRTTPRLKEEAL